MTLSDRGPGRTAKPLFIGSIPIAASTSFIYSTVTCTADYPRFSFESLLGHSRRLLRKLEHIDSPTMTETLMKSSRNGTTKTRENNLFGEKPLFIDFDSPRYISISER